LTVTGTAFSARTNGDCSTRREYERHHGSAALAEFLLHDMAKQQRVRVDDAVTSVAVAQHGP
jgi:hypothetical protein